MYDRRCERSGRPAAADRDPTLDSAGRASGRGVLRLGVRPGRRSHGVPLPRGRADRAPARSHHPHARGLQGSPGLLGRDRLPDLRGGDPPDPGRDRHDRRQPDEDGRQQVQRLFHRQARTDVGRPRRRPAPALARHPPPAEHQDPAERPPAREANPPAGRRTLHPPDRQLRRGGGDLDRQGDLRLRADRRRLDLHAPRHAAAFACRRPPFPAARGEAVDLEDGARPGLVRPRPGRRSA